MEKRNLVSLGLLSLVVLGGYFMVDKTEVKQEEEIQPKLVSTSSEESPLVPAKDKTEEGLPTITRGELATLRDTLPHKTDVKKEVAENPHQTAPSLVKFAEVLGGLMDKGLKRVEDASVLLNELTECVADDAVSETAQVLCLSHSEKLAIAFPDLKAGVDQIHSVANPAALKLLKKKKTIIKQ